MISLQELKNLSIDRLEDAKVLFKASRFDGAFYICGYAVEVGLKRTICKTLGWEGFPKDRKEFESLNSFKTHDLEILVHLSGKETEIKEKYFSEWSIVTSWDPEIRYSPKKLTSQEVKLMLNAAETLLSAL